MRRTRFLLALIGIAIMGLLVDCAGMTGPEQGTLIKITARRVAFHGYKLKPDMFTSLGEIANQACVNSGNQEHPFDVAFQAINKAITLKTSDPLLAQDLKDVAELIGIKFDAAFTLLGLTPDRLKFISLFVCAFDQGIQAAQTITN